MDFGKILRLTNAFNVIPHEMPVLRMLLMIEFRVLTEHILKMVHASALQGSFTIQIALTVLLVIMNEIHAQDQHPKIVYPA